MDVRTAVVIGAGTMGTGIAYVLAAAGIDVWLVDPDDGQRDRARRAIADRARRAIAERARRDLERTADAERRARLNAIGSRVWPVTDLTAVSTAPLDAVIEAVPERAELKRAVLAQAERLHPALLATNTSSLTLAVLAADLTDPASLVGMHFFNPVWSMPLVELVSANSTAARSMQAARELAARLGKEVIELADSPGFATSRLGVALALEAIRMVEEQVATPADLDKAMELGYRHPMGPLRLTDLVGLDVRLDIAGELQRAYGDRFAPPQLLVDKVARGELGRKSGQGFYRWPGPQGGHSGP